MLFRSHAFLCSTPPDKIEFSVHISEVSGTFEVKEGGAVVASGLVRLPSSNPLHRETRMDDDAFGMIASREGEGNSIASSSRNDLCEVEVYRFCRMLGMDYSGAFRTIRAASSDLRLYQVAWSGNWVTFLDAHLQSMILVEGMERRPMVQSKIAKVFIDPVKVLESLRNNSPSGVTQEPGGGVRTDRVEHKVIMLFDKNLALIKSPGVELHWSEFTRLASLPKEPAPSLHSYSFSSYFDDKSVGAGDLANPPVSPTLQCVSIALDNLHLAPGVTNSEEGTALKICELHTREPTLQESLAVEASVRYRGVSFEYLLFARRDRERERTDLHPQELKNSSIDLRAYSEFDGARWLRRDYDLVIVHEETFLVLLASQYLKHGSFLLFKVSRVPSSPTLAQLQDRLGPKFRVVAHKGSEKEVVLDRKSVV